MRPWRDAAWGGITLNLSIRKLYRSAPVWMKALYMRVFASYAICSQRTSAAGTPLIERKRRNWLAFCILIGWKVDIHFRDGWDRLQDSDEDNGRGPDLGPMPMPIPVRPVGSTPRLGSGANTTE
jgi:hypothetical protein